MLNNLSKSLQLEKGAGFKGLLSLGKTFSNYRPSSRPAMGLLQPQARVVPFWASASPHRALAFCILGWLLVCCLDCTGSVGSLSPLKVPQPFSGTEG